MSHKSNRQSNNRQSPTTPKGFICKSCKKDKSILEGHIEEDDNGNKFCSKDCKSTFSLAIQDDLNKRNKLEYIIENNCKICDKAIAEYKKLKDTMKGGGAIEIGDNTLEKKLIDATAPYNEKAARNAGNFAKASIEVGKAILEQLNLDPLAFINKAKELGIKISKITQEGIYLLFPGDDNIGQSVDKLIKSGTKIYFLPVRILGTIIITIFLSMFDVFIPLNFLGKIPGLKPFIELIMKYTSIIPTILKNIKIPNLSIPNLSLKNFLYQDVLNAAYGKKNSNKQGGRKKTRKKKKIRKYKDKKKKISICNE